MTTPEPDALQVTAVHPDPHVGESRSPARAGRRCTRSSGEPYPPLDDIEAWPAYVDAANEMLIAMFDARLADVQATVAVREVDGVDVDVYVVTPEGLPDHDDQPICLDIHGGALVMGGGAALPHDGAQLVARHVQMRTWAVDYRMPPDHPYPDRRSTTAWPPTAPSSNVQAPERIIVERAARPAGNLAAALVLRARDEGLPMPAALVLLTPEVDLTESGDTFQTNLGIDSVLVGSLAAPNALYAGGHDLADPVPLAAVRRLHPTVPAHVPPGRNPRPLPLERRPDAPLAPGRRRRRRAARVRGDAPRGILRGSRGRRARHGDPALRGGAPSAIGTSPRIPGRGPQ